MTATLPQGASHPDALSRREGRDEIFPSERADCAPERFQQKHLENERRGKPSLPRLRKDLTISQQVTAEGVIFVIKDPLLDRFYRFPQEAHFIASQLDGNTELEVVRKRTEEKFKTPCPP